MKILSQSEVIKRLGVPRQTFEQGVRPLMEELGDARNLGGGRRASWAYSSKNLWQWELYIATRKKLIEAGEWSIKRPYSIRDMEDISLVGMYEDYMPNAIGETMRETKAVRNVISLKVSIRNIADACSESEMAHGAIWQENGQTKCWLPPATKKILLDQTGLSDRGSNATLADFRKYLADRYDNDVVSKAIVGY